jgi:hypothetical protein
MTDDDWDEVLPRLAENAAAIKAHLKAAEQATYQLTRQCLLVQVQVLLDERFRLMGLSESDISQINEATDAEYEVALLEQTASMDVVNERVRQRK